MTIKDRIITPGPTEAAKQERPVTLDDVLRILLARSVIDGRVIQRQRTSSAT